MPDWKGSSCTAIYLPSYWHLTKLDIQREEISETENRRLCSFRFKCKISERYSASLLFVKFPEAMLRLCQAWDDNWLWMLQWWPTAEFEQLRIVTFLAIWLFLWDDELDEPTGVHTNNFETAQKYRAETEQFLRECLKLDNVGKKQELSSYQLVSSFRNFGLQLSSAVGQYLGLSFQKTINVGHILEWVFNMLSLLKNTISWAFGQDVSKSPPVASSPMIESFRVIGDALANAYTIGMVLCSSGDEVLMTFV